MGKPILSSLDGRRLGLAGDGSLVGAGRASGVTASVAAGTANQTLVTLQIVDNEDAAVSGVRMLDLWLSDATTGAGLTATTASGAVAVGASGADIIDYVSKKAKRVQTDATGKYILAITDTAKTAFKVCAQLGPMEGAIVAATLATASYG